jgi:O-antigen/teichoic acid export membrane protein
MHLMATALALNLFTSLVMAVIIAVLFFSGLLADIFREVHPRLAWYVPAGILAVGWYQALNYWSTRRKTYRNNAISKVVQANVNVVISIVLGYLLAGAEGMVAGFVAGYLLGCLVLALRLKNDPALQIRHAWSRKQAAAVTVRFRNFIYFNTPHAVLDVLVDQGIVYLIKAYFEKMILGSYAFAYRMLRAPVSLITSSVSQVFYEQASRIAGSGGDVRPLMRSVQKNLLMIGIVPFMAIMTFTPGLFAFIFSEEYRQAGEIARYILPWIFLNYLTSPLSTITLVRNRQRQAMMITGIDLLCRIIAIFAGVILENYRISFILLGIFCSLILIFANRWYYIIARPPGRAVV